MPQGSWDMHCAKQIVSIVMSGTAPAFYKILVTDELVDAISCAQHIDLSSTTLLLKQSLEYIYYPELRYL
jgi:hypothetical protein